MELNSINLSSLRDFCKTLEISIDNDDYNIDEMGGPEVYEIRLDVNGNMLLKINDDNSLSTLEQYTNADFAGIPENYIERESFEGLYCISSLDENKKWTIEFHGASIEDQSGDISQNEVEIISEALNPKNLYKLIDEVLSNCSE